MVCVQGRAWELSSFQEQETCVRTEMHKVPMDDGLTFSRLAEKVFLIPHRIRHPHHPRQLKLIFRSCRCPSVATFAVRVHIFMRIAFEE